MVAIASRIRRANVGMAYPSLVPLVADEGAVCVAVHQSEFVLLCGSNHDSGLRHFPSCQCIELREIYFPVSVVAGHLKLFLADELFAEWAKTTPSK